MCHTLLRGFYSNPVPGEMGKLTYPCRHHAAALVYLDVVRVAGKLGGAPQHVNRPIAKVWKVC